MQGDNRGRLFNLLSIAMLVATACLLGFYGLVVFNVFNPFPTPPSVGNAPSPTPTPVITPTPTVTSIPTWTPTATPTITPTPGPTRTPTPTATPSPTFTFPPTITLTPSPTRGPWPFDCRDDLRTPELSYGPWTGLAGQVEDMEGNPLPGYNIKVKCPGAGTHDRRAGANEMYNLIYDHEAAWEQACNPTEYQKMEIRVQMYDIEPGPDGVFETVSAELIVKLPGISSRSLGYVTCTLVWDDWLEPAEGAAGESE